jgi:hypothetical protein
MCAFFHNRDEEYRVLLPFVRDGIEQLDLGFHIVDPARLVLPEEFLRELRTRQPQHQPGSPR